MEKSQEKIITMCLVIITMVAIAFALYWLRPVLVPFVLAMFFFFIFQEMIDLQCRYLKMPRPAAVASTVLINMLFLALVVFLVYSSAGQMASNMNAYQAKIKEFLGGTAAGVLQERWNIDVQNMIRQWIDGIGEQAAKLIGATANAVLGLVSQGIIVLVFFLFLLLDSSKKKRASALIWRKSEEKIKKYIMSKFFISAIQGIIIGGVFTFFGIDMALMFGFFAFVLNFIPSFGPIIAALLPLPVILVTPEISPVTGFFAFAVPAVILFSIGNFVEPKAIGDVLRLRPVTILMALIFWGMLWGVTGMFLAVPLTAVLVLILDGLEVTKPAAEFLSVDRDAGKRG
ncbi:MAG: AI-2E family transporter [Candidatus Goldiibacteriota bacterium]